MKRWLQSVNEKMQRWMYGRYGYDELSGCLLVIALVCIVLSVFSDLNLDPIAFALLIWGVFRTYSRNIGKRMEERNAYLNFTAKIRRYLRRRQNMWRERKTHRYFKCPDCGTYLRVPKGRGRIEISCPKCRNTIVRKT